MMKEDLGVSNAQAWGCPCAPPINIRRLKRLSLGMPPCIPFFINNYQFVPRCTIFYHFMRYVLCFERLALYFFRFVLALLAVPNKLDPSFLLCGRETRSA